MAEQTRPNFPQYCGYLLGKTLPDRYQDWVRNDLVGPGAQARYIIRFTVPA